MMKTYTTKQGQAWDEIALEVYGDEKYTGYLMINNFPHIDTMIFSAGETLDIPDLPDEIPDGTPAWTTQEVPDSDPYE